MATTESITTCNGVNGTNTAVTHTIRRSFGSYNNRRYSRPWGAIVTLQNGKPTMDFCGTYYGRHGEAGDVILTNIPTGAIVAFGQKDGRNPKHTENTWFFVNSDGSIAEIDRAAAYDVLSRSTATVATDVTITLTAGEAAYLKAQLANAQSAEAAEILNKLTGNS
jgi:hypothetical protein